MKTIFRDLESILKNGSVRRTVQLSAPGLVRIKQTIHCQGGEGTDISGPYWILGLVHIKEGNLTYLRGKSEITPPSQTFAMFVPPFTLIQVNLRGIFEIEALSSRRPLEGVPQTPLVFSPPTCDLPQKISQIPSFIHEGRFKQIVGREDNPRAISRKIKNLIDAHYNQDLTLTDLGHRCGLSSSLLSRYFKNDYGYSPLKYRHWMRVMEAMSLLCEGVAVKEVAHEVGYEDLGRFYKQFKKIALVTPGHYAQK